MSAYLGKEWAVTTTDQRGNIEKAIDEWFSKWEEAWYGILLNVATCEERCPACGSAKTGYNDPLHCFFTCNEVEKDGCGENFIEKAMEILPEKCVAGVSPMVLLKNPSVFPWALKHVDTVHQLRVERKKTLEQVPPWKRIQFFDAQVKKESPLFHEKPNGHFNKQSTDSRKERNRRQINRE